MLLASVYYSIVLHDRGVKASVYYSAGMVGVLMASVYV